MLHKSQNGQVKNPQRISKYKEIAKNLNYQGINFPVSIDQIPRIEEQNRISVFVWEYDQVEDTKFPIYRSKNNYPVTLTLLRITDKQRAHYVYIKNTKAFFADLTKNTAPVYICVYCGKRTENPNTLLVHEKSCFGQEYTPELTLPPKNNGVNETTFKNFNKAIPPPFVIFTDFEAFTNPVHSTSPNPDISYTEALQYHTPRSYGL